MATLLTRILKASAIAVVSGIIATHAPAYSRSDDLTAGQWYARALNLTAAHRLSVGTGVLVAVVDSGADATHVELKGHVVPGADFSDGGALSIGDGRVDKDGHGTQMASLIVGGGKIAGVAPGAKIMPVRDHVSEVGSAASVATAIRWATQNGAKIISVSLGTGDDPRLSQAVDAALEKGIVVVAAAGNTDRDSTVQYPAAYPGVVAACGTNAKGEHSSVSVGGPELVLCAPSDNLSSAYPGGRYALGTGTSESTAIIAGAAALVWAKFPYLSGSDVVHRLVATASDKGPPGRDDQYGYGLVDIVGALTKSVPQTAPSTGSVATSGADAKESQDSAPWRLILGGLVCALALVLVGGVTIIAIRWARAR